MECLECFDSWKSKNMWFYICENIVVVATIMAKHVDIFCYTNVYCEFSIEFFKKGKKALYLLEDRFTY